MILLRLRKPMSIASLLASKKIWFLSSCFIGAVTFGCGQGQTPRPDDTSATPVMTTVSPSPSLPVDNSASHASTSVEVSDQASTIQMKAATYLSVEEESKNYSLEPARIQMGDDMLQNSVALQDDNLLTHVECAVGSESPCVIEIRLPAICLVKGLRFFGGRGTSRKDYLEGGRIKQLRVRTADAVGEATLDDHWDFTWVMFDAPVKTQFVRVEILSVYGKKRTSAVSIAEFDVLGESGTSRPPLRVDWHRVYTKTDGNFWRGNKFQDSWIEQIDVKGNRQRLFRGTVVHGRRNRRYLIAQRFVRAECPGAMYYQDSRYTLIDTQHRMFYALQLRVQGALEISSRQNGEGFFIKGYSLNDDLEIYQTLTFDDGVVRLDDLDTASTVSISKALAELGFSRDVLRYGTGKEELYGVVRPCKSMGRLTASLKKRAAVALGWTLDDVSTVSWEKCTLPDGRAVYLLGHMCDENSPVSVLIEQPAGEIRAKKFTTYGQVDLRVFGDGSVRISAERNSGVGGDIFDVDDDGALKLLIKDALFLPGPAPNCRCSA